MTAARHAVRMLREQNNCKEAASVAQRAVQLIPLVYGRYLSRRDQQHAIIQISGLAADSCSLSLKVGFVHKALQQLEFRRGLILGYPIDNRSDLSKLRKTHNDLADTYDKLRFQLSRDISTQDPIIRDRMIEEREMAGSQMGHCLNQIR